MIKGISDSHRVAFESYYRQLPDVVKAIDEGVDVTETFTDSSGNEHYCHEHPGDVLVEWLKENPEEARDIRKEFVVELAENIKIRRDITLYRKHPGLDKIHDHERRKDVEAIYMAGARDAADMLISMTDDRELNLARWRLTTTEGKVVSFCNPEDKGYLDTPGLIVLFHNQINT